MYVDKPTFFRTCVARKLCDHTNMICLMSNFRLLAVNLQLSAGHGWEVLKVQQTNSSQQVIEGEQLDQGISPHHSIQCRLVRTEFMQQMLVIKQTQPIMIRTKF